MDHFRDIMIIISAVGLIIIMIIIFSVIAGSKKKVTTTEKKDKKSKIVMDIEPDEYTDQGYLVSPDDLLFPTLNTFDMTSDFEEFLPKKKYELPEMTVIVDNYKELFDKSIEESLKFNFEKRKKE